MEWFKEKENNKALFRLLKTSLLFNGLSENEIASCLDHNFAAIEHYRKNDMLFSENDIPAGVILLISGSIAMGKHTRDGKRHITSIINNTGDIIGFEQLFLKDDQQGFFAKAMRSTNVLVMHRGFLEGACEKNCPHHKELIANIIELMANKALDSGSRLETVSSGSLRSRIASFVLFNTNTDNQEALIMKRQDMADYLNTTRPSLSRELMKMQREGLIEISDKAISVNDINKLKNLLI